MQLSYNNCLDVYLKNRLEVKCSDCKYTQENKDDFVIHYEFKATNIVKERQCSQQLLPLVIQCVDCFNKGRFYKINAPVQAVKNESELILTLQTKIKVLENKLKDLEDQKRNQLIQLAQLQYSILTNKSSKDPSVQEFVNKNMTKQTKDSILPLETFYSNYCHLYEKNIEQDEELGFMRDQVAYMLQQACVVAIRQAILSHIHYFESILESDIKEAQQNNIEIGILSDDIMKQHGSAFMKGILDQTRFKKYIGKEASRQKLKQKKDLLQELLFIKKHFSRNTSSLNQSKNKI